jgi:hypothetical protein
MKKKLFISLFLLLSYSLFLSLSRYLKSERGSLHEFLQEFIAGHSMKYTSFDPTLSGIVYEDLWGMDLTWL